MWWWSNSNWTYCDYFWVSFIETEGITAVLLTVSINIGMQSGVYESVCFKLGMMRDTIALYILIRVNLTLTFLQVYRSLTKQDLLRQLSLEKFQSIWMDFGLLLRLVGVMYVIFILFRPFTSQGRELYLWFRLKQQQQQKLLTMARNQTFTDRFLSNLVWW